MSMSTGLSRSTIRQCLMRSSMLNTAYSARGLQSMGFLYSIIPGLRELHPDNEAFAQSCARYARHFNCHVFWAPFLCGAFLHTERQIAAGSFNQEMFDMFKETTLNSLSAVGDSFISGSLIVSCMLVLALLLLLDNPLAACLFLLIWLLLDLFIKLASFYLGLARGFILLRGIRRLNLINKSDYLKIFNGILLATLLALALGFVPGVTVLPGAGFDSVLETWLMPVTTLALSAYAVARLHISRCLIVALLIGGAWLFI